MKRKLGCFLASMALVVSLMPLQTQAAVPNAEVEVSEITYQVTDVNGYATARLDGVDRYETGLMCAETIRLYEEIDQFDEIVLASGTNFPDALAGASLAGQNVGTPIILVGASDEANQEVYYYMSQFVKRDAKIYVLGGTAAIPESVLNTISSYGFSNITRLAGNDRYETNMAIINEMDTSDVRTIVVATGKNYADSLAISGYAYEFEWPIFLVGDSLTEAQLAKIREINPNEVQIVGGYNAISQEVENQITAITGTSAIVRYNGADRYDTAMKVADRWCWTATDYDEDYYDAIGVVTYGGNFPDALSASALAGTIDAPIILVGSDANRQSAFLRSSTQIGTLVVVGGQAAVPDSVLNQFYK